jgi:hypothetical protein
LAVRRAPEADERGSCLELAVELAERELETGEIRSVMLDLRSERDSQWVGRAIEWIAARGRRPLVRFCVPDRSVARIAHDAGATAVLACAARDVAIQRATWGNEAASVDELLLFAQHLEWLGIGIGAWWGPIFSGLEDTGNFEALAHHLRGAGIRDVHIAVGHLTRSRWDALARVLGSPARRSLARAFELHEANAAALPMGEERRAKRSRAISTYAAVRRAALRGGLRVDACGCPLFCRLDPQSDREVVPLATGDLFARVG